MPDHSPLDPASKESSSTAPSTPKLHIDSDWKAQAHAEKERLSKQEQEREQSRGKIAGPEGGPSAPGSEELPPAEFHTLVNMLASQAVMSLGGYGDPKSGRVIVDLPGAKLSIDLLAVLEQKTKGNLTAEEGDDLREVLAALRGRFVHFVDLVAKQQMAGGVPAGAPVDPVSLASKLRTS